MQENINSNKELEIFIELLKCHSEVNDQNENNIKIRNI